MRSLYFAWIFFLINGGIIGAIWLENQLHSKQRKTDEFNKISLIIGRDNAYVMNSLIELVKIQKENPQIQTVDFRYKNTPVEYGIVMMDDGNPVLFVYETFHENNNTGIDRVDVWMNGKIVKSLERHLCCGAGTFQGKAPMKTLDELVRVIER